MGGTEGNLVEGGPPSAHMCAMFLLMGAHIGEMFYFFLHTLLSSQLNS